MVYQVIDKVAKNHSKKIFPGVTSDDIYQTAWIIALTKSPEFDIEKSTTEGKDPSKSYEKWLNRVVANRLHNFYRDNYKVPKKNFNFVSLDEANPREFNLNFTSMIDDSDYRIVILSNLNDEMLEILEALLNGEAINSYYKAKLLKTIKKIRDEICQNQKPANL